MVPWTHTSQPQTASRSVHLFLYTLPCAQIADLSLSVTSQLWMNFVLSSPNLIQGFFDPPTVILPNSISISSAIFAQHIRVTKTQTDMQRHTQTDRQTDRLTQTHIQTYRHTDHPTCDICSNRPHLMHCMQVMRPKKRDLQSVFV